MERCYQETTGDLITVPSERGELSILSHVASAQTGLSDRYMLLCRGSKSKKSADYHSEMNRDVFSDLCNRFVFPAIASRRQSTVLVSYSATYHTYVDGEDRRPSPLWNQNWTSDSNDRREGPSEDCPLAWRYMKTKAQLLEEPRRIYPSSIYKIPKIACKFKTITFKLKVLFLTVARPELNPIEMVWGYQEESGREKHELLFKWSWKYHTVEFCNRQTVNEA